MKTSERYEIRRLYFPQIKDLPAIHKLLGQLSGRKECFSFRKAVERYFPAFVQEGAYIYGVRDRRLKNQLLIGMAGIYFTDMLSGLKASIEDVVVDKKYRGLGLGEKLTKALIGAARKKKAKCVDLTSRPSRVEANALYQKLGFKKRETNVYRLNLK